MWPRWNPCRWCPRSGRPGISFGALEGFEQGAHVLEVELVRGRLGQLVAEGEHTGDGGFVGQGLAVLRWAVANSHTPSQWPVNKGIKDTVLGSSGGQRMAAWNRLNGNLGSLARHNNC